MSHDQRLHVPIILFFLRPISSNFSGMQYFHEPWRSNNSIDLLQAKG